jgi:hypothetical protein
MTISELLGSSADQLDKLTPQQLNEWFEPYLKVTRPELAIKEHKASSGVRHSTRSNKAQSIAEQLELTRRLKLAETLAAQKGLNLKLT